VHPRPGYGASVISCFQQAGRQHIAHPLIVVWVEPEQLLKVADRCPMITLLPANLRECEAGAHVRPRFEDAPERPDFPFECLWSERALPSLHGLLVERLFLGRCPHRLLGQDVVGIRAIWVDAQRQPGQGDAIAYHCQLPGIVAELLRDVGQVDLGKRA